MRPHDARSSLHSICRWVTDNSRKDDYSRHDVVVFLTRQVHCTCNFVSCKILRAQSIRLCFRFLILDKLQKFSWFRKFYRRVIFCDSEIRPGRLCTSVGNVQQAQVMHHQPGQRVFFSFHYCTRSGTCVNFYANIFRFHQLPRNKICFLRVKTLLKK